MAFDSDDEKEGAENQLLTSLENPLDAGDPDGSDRPPRYASASDFSFLPKDLKIITDGGPGTSLTQACVSLIEYICLTHSDATGCGGVSQAAGLGRFEDC